MKLLGKAAYGKTLNNKTKHEDAAYVRSERTSKSLNNPRSKEWLSLLTSLIFLKYKHTNI